MWTRNPDRSLGAAGVSKYLVHHLGRIPPNETIGRHISQNTPQRTMSAFELTRYLDYCSERLSLTSKLAAVYAQNLPDPVVIDAVNEIESLTTNLSQKIWQKITILDAS